MSRIRPNLLVYIVNYFYRERDAIKKEIEEKLLSSKNRLVSDAVYPKKGSILYFKTVPCLISQKHINIFQVISQKIFSLLAYVSNKEKKQCVYIHVS